MPLFGATHHEAWIMRLSVVLPRHALATWQLLIVTWVRDAPSKIPGYMLSGNAPGAAFGVLASVALHLQVFLRFMACAGAAPGRLAE